MLHFFTAASKFLLYLPIHPFGGPAVVQKTTNQEMCLDNRALSELNVSNNNLTQGALLKNSDSEEEEEEEYETDMSGVIALADVLKK